MRIVTTKRFRYQGGWAVPGDILEVSRRRGAFLTRLGLAFNLDIGGTALGVGGGGPGSGGIPETVGVSSLVGTSTVGSVSLDVPQQTEEGDLLIAIIAMVENRWFSDTPSEMSPLVDFIATGQSAWGIRLGVWTRVVESSDPASYGWDLETSTDRFTSAMLAVHVDGGTPSVPPGGFQTAIAPEVGEGGITVPEVTMPDDGLLVGGFATGSWNNKIMTNPPGMTSRFTNPIAHQEPLRVSDEIVEQGETGSRTSMKDPDTSSASAGILIQVVG